MINRKTVSISMGCAVLAAIGGLVFKQWNNSPAPSVGMDDVRSTIFSAVQLYRVVSGLQANEISTNFQAMVKISQAPVTPGVDGFCDYVSKPSDCVRQISTNKNGAGGWFYDPQTKSLSLNLTNRILVNWDGRKLMLPADFFAIHPDGLHYSFGSEFDAALNSYFEDFRAKAESFLELSKAAK